MTTPGRQRTLTAALELFSERGYTATSMRDLAARLGIQAATLYSHYTGKDDLLHHAVQPLLDDLEQLLQQDHPHLDINAWLQDYAHTLAQHRAAVRIIGSDLAVGSSPLGTTVAGLNARTRQLLQRHTNLSELEAAATLGALWWPLICLTEPLTGQDLAQLVPTLRP